MADQRRFDFCVVFTIILYDANFFVWSDMKLKFHSHLQIALVSLCNDLGPVQFQMIKVLTFFVAEARNGSW